MRDEANKPNEAGNIESSAFPMGGVGRARTVAALFGPVYLVTVFTGYLFQLTPESGSAFWPASGLVLAALLLTPYRVWPLLVVITIAAESLAAWYFYGLPGSWHVAFDFANPVEALISASLLRRWAPRFGLTSNVHRLLGFAVVAVFFGTGVGAFLGAASIWALRPEAVYWQTWHVWWLGDALGVLAVTPLILVWAGFSWQTGSRPTTPRISEALVLLGGLAVTAHFVFSSAPAIRSILSFPYLLFPFLLWAAFRFRPPLVTVACLVMATIAVWYTTQGRGPFLVMGDTPYGHTLALQTCLLVSCLCPMILAAAVEDRRNETRRRVAIEHKLRQAQKLEVVGQLAAGVAHDFNNYLMVISGHTESIARKVQGSDPLHAHTRHIAEACDRATSLTRRLLAFSRSQAMKPRTVEVNTVLTGIERMAGELLGRDIALHTIPSDEPSRVTVDPEQLEVAILNLAVNSRDAMPDGGTVTIQCKTLQLGVDYCDRHPEVSPGRFVLIRVSDAGTGMSEDVRIRCFEPFFTSKKIGHGTGLGLSTVLDIVQRSNGSISVDTEEGKGTTFDIYLPRT